MLVATTAYVLRTTDHPVTIGVGGAAGSAFDKKGTLDPSVRRAWYSPDGTRLAVLGSDGLGLAEEGKPVSVSRGAVVDAAWMPASNALLVVEGPSQVEQLSEIDLRGAVIGVAHLDAPFSVGNGNGIAVDRRGARAAVTTETRDAIGGRHRTDIALVDLQTGHVTPVTQTPDTDESLPQFLDDDHVVFARNGAVVERGLTDGRERVVSVDGEHASPLGVVGGGILVYQARTPNHVDVVAILADGRHQRLGRVGADASMLSVDPSGTRAVAAVRQCCDSIVLRIVTLAPPRRVG